MKNAIKNIPDRFKTDLVIVGGGGSGLAAAVAAAENGIKNIVVLEKRNNPGGNAAMAEGIFAVESGPQKRQGIDASRDETFRLFMDYTHWRVDPRLVSAYINKSAETIQWLADKGVRLEHISREFLKQPFPTFHMAPPKTAGGLIVKALLSDCEKAGVKILCGIRTGKLLVDKESRISGVSIETKEGKKRVSAKNVVIATGGYAGNRDLLKKYWPDFRPDRIVITEGILHTGDGLMMATEIGAAEDARGSLHMEGPDFLRARRTTQVGAIAHEPNTIWVNKKGKRFVDESIDTLPVTANALHRQPDGICYTLFDEKIKSSICTQGTIKSSMPGVFAARGSKLPELDEELQLEAEAGTVKIADSWEEISRWIGTSPESLETEIAEYNRFCDQGYDEVMGKDRRYLQPLRNPPYYGARCGGFMGISQGAIKVSHSLEVLDDRDDQIPGLYAVGNDAGGWQWDTYSIIFSGFALGFAINSGRMAAEKIASLV
jgi:fumarate reductase flavoprotein subunit